MWSCAMRSNADARSASSAHCRFGLLPLTTWFIEGDISRCFDQLDHSVMLATLGEKIHDNRLLRLIGQMLRAGYLEDWVWNATLSGAPQGALCSAEHKPPYAQ